MAEQKIAFITCVNNSEQYEASRQTIDKLFIPSGFTLEKIIIRNALSITSAYQQAMQDSDAKYKIYLHQDVFIYDRGMLFSIINLFKRYSDLGLLGVIGAKKLPASGIWWEAAEKYGKVYSSHAGFKQLLCFSEVTKDFETVQAIDGLIMITQYDLPWRNDLVKGWHFYDLSQSLEFQKAGLKVGIPKQPHPWCFHDCGRTGIQQYEEYRQILLENYSEFFPPCPAPKRRLAELPNLNENRPIPSLTSPITSIGCAVPRYRHSSQSFKFFLKNHPDKRSSGISP